MNSHQASWRTRTVLTFAAALAAAAGCTTRPAIVPISESEQNDLANRDELTLALENLEHVGEGADPQARQRSIYYLNQWLASQKLSSDWKPDPLVERIPRDLQNTPGLERLNELQFHTEVDYPKQILNLLSVEFRKGIPKLEADLSYLQTCLWLRQIADRSVLEPRPPLLADWFREMESTVGLPESEQLAAAERLFDWTVRNIQLDPLPPPPPAASATAGPQSQDPLSPALLGEIGPGYSAGVRDVLIFGHGDSWQRARVFIALCRQRGIDAVMLAIQQETSPVPRGWLPAVFIGNELYLFDTALGLPIPGPEGKGIATLSQAYGSPSLLRELDLPDGLKYPVSEEELRRVIALIDAQPDALSRRMLLLQEALPADSSMVLAVEPSKLESRLRGAKKASIGQVSLWRVPFEAEQFRLGRIARIQTNQDYRQQMLREQSAMTPLPGLLASHNLLPARSLHLQGRYSTTDDEQGARTLYLSARAPDAETDKIESSAFVREAFGIQLPPDETQQKAIIQLQSDVRRTQKHHATYWLGLTYYDAAARERRPQDRVRAYRTTIEWLAERTLPVFPPSPWLAGAQYNLARTYEQLGQWNDAKKWLEADKESPQRAGNLLRAKLISEWQQKQREPSSDDKATADGEK